MSRSGTKFHAKRRTLIYGSFWLVMGRYGSF